MARIRTVKPEFFRHRKLYLAEKETGLPLRIAFAGMWTVADREGRFKWEPDELKLDCLPYDDVDFEMVMTALEIRGFIQGYEVDGRAYGYIPSWGQHQHINIREAQSLLPDPHVQTRAKKVRARGEGKGKEGKGKEGENAPLGADDKLLLEFEQWYAFYPHKKARGDALKAYLKARKTVDHATLIAGVERYKKSKPDWQEWAFPASWLNDQRWLDEDTTALATAPEKSDPELAFKQRAGMVAKGIKSTKTIITNADMDRMVAEQLVTEEQAMAYGWIKPGVQLADPGEIPDFLRRTA